MKFISIFSALVFLIGCLSAKKNTAVSDNCKDLPKLRWQDEGITRNDSALLKLTADVMAAARFDADVSRRIQDSLELKFESQLAKKLNTVANSKVSQNFWEADIAFRQYLCFLNTKITDKRLSSSVKQELEKLYIDILKSQKIYVEELQKKTSVTK